jgi:UDP-2,3-diacylglucosamine pyrophosphatase LpxH
VFAPRELLIVSDMHVGRSCKEITGFAQLKPDPEFDLAFIDLLDVYTKGKEKDWRLIIGGDFIDFMEVVVAPGAKGFLDLNLTFDVTDEEREFGLGSEAERVLVKLDRTFSYHRAFFKRLSQFVKEGGELVLIRGNHDVEFYWRKVQKVFRRMLADLAFAGLQLDVDEAIEQRNAFQERIHFLPWIYFEEGKIYFEHGHQYDEYCSFDHWLHPVSPTNPRRIDTPISHFAMRYFVNLMNDFVPHNVDVWTWKDYARWLRQKGIASTVYMVRMGVRAVVRMFEYAVQWTFGRVHRYHRDHQKKLYEEAARFSISVEKISAIDGLHHTPVSRNIAELMRLLFLDRILLVLGALFLALLILVIVDSALVELVGLILTVVLLVRINRQMAPRRHLQPGPKQAGAARRIAEILGVPLVVMGHSHVRRDIELGPNQRYINTGCWLPPLATALNHVDPSEPCTCKLSHLVVPRDGRAELRVFCKATRAVRLTDIAEASVPTADLPHNPQHDPVGDLVP